jgi:hypothetical protein
MFGIGKITSAIVRLAGSMCSLADTLDGINRGLQHHVAAHTAEPIALPPVPVEPPSEPASTSRRRGKAGVEGNGSNPS